MKFRKLLAGLVISTAAILAFAGNPFDLNFSPFINEDGNGAFSNTLSLGFDGSPERVSTPFNATQIPSTNISAGCWFKVDTPSETQQYFFAQYEGADTRWWMASSTTGASGSTGEMQLLVSEDDNVTTRKVYYTSVDVFDGTWNHVFWTFSDNVLKIYINGAEDTPLKSEDTEVNFVNVTTASTTTMGDRTNAGVSGAIGLVDECVIFAATLNDAAVLEAYNGGEGFDYTTHTNFSDLVLWYRNGDDDNDTATVIVDQTGNQNGVGNALESDDFVLDTPP